MPVATHKDLEVWKRAIDLVGDVYKLSVSFPKEELFGLTSQVRRAAVSIPSNIAEGAARRTTKEFIQYLYVAVGSLAELDTQLVIAKKPGYTIDTYAVEESLTVVRKMLLGLIKSLKK